MGFIIGRIFNADLLAEKDNRFIDKIIFVELTVIRSAVSKQ